MLRVLTILLLLCAPLCAQTGTSTPKPADTATIDDMEFDIRRPFRETRHPSETPRYRATGVGEIGLAFNIFYTARSYNISDIGGLDNSLASSWLYSFDPWGLGGRAHIEWRISPEWWLSIMPRTDVAFGILNTSYHNTNEIEGLPFTRNYQSANDMQKLSVNFELEVSARWRYMWFVTKASIWSVFRKRSIRTNDSDHFDSQLGTLGPVKDRKRVEWEQAYVFGAATGIGFEFFFLPEAYRFIVMGLWRPFNTVMWRDKSSVTNGFEFMIRSADFVLTHQVGIFFEMSMQLYLPTDNFNDIYYTQFSLGIKFK